MEEIFRLLLKKLQFDKNITDEIEKFRIEFKQEPEFSLYEDKLNTAQIQVLYNQGYYKQSLSLINNYYADSIFDLPSFTLQLIHIKCLIKTNDYSLAKNILKHKLTRGDEIELDERINLLYLFSLVEENESEILFIHPILESVKSELGYESRSLNFREEIQRMFRVYIDSYQSFSKLMSEIFQLNPTDKKTKLTDFIKTQELTYFKDLASEYLPKDK